MSSDGRCRCRIETGQSAYKAPYAEHAFCKGKTSNRWLTEFSWLDGWRTEACAEGVNGWAIGGANSGTDAGSFHDKREKAVLPLYFGDAESWRMMMRNAIAQIGYFFNSQRMMRRYASCPADWCSYASEAYLPRLERGGR
jgi:hypothetical protein